MGRNVGGAGATIAAIAVAVGLWPGLAAATHTVFSFRVDRVELDGNNAGPADGVADVVDDFTDAMLEPNWYRAYGTVTESGGFLVLSNPGTHFPSPIGTLTDVSIAGSKGALVVDDGAGDFTATAAWEQTIPPVGHHFHFSLFTYGGNTGSAFYNEIFGLALTRTDAALQVEQHLTEIDQAQGIYRNTLLDFFDVSAADVTGAILFRLHVDDATNVATSSFSLDGGVTWQSPFQSAPIFAGRTRAQLLLSADPMAAGSATTTTTTTVAGSTTTTSTTVPAAPCTASGCRTGLSGRLTLVDQPSKARRSLSWKLGQGEAMSTADLGDPVAGAVPYRLCLADATGATIFSATLPAGGTCGTKPCWKDGGDKGLKYKNPEGTPDGITAAVFKAGVAGKSAALAKGKGPSLGLPALPLALPVTLRLETSAGQCWAAVFAPVGAKKNTDEKFDGKSGSPSGAFL